MIGDSVSEMEFGKKAGMFTIFFGENQPTSTYIDCYAKNWLEVAALFTK